MAQHRLCRRAALDLREPAFSVAPVFDFNTNATCGLGSRRPAHPCDERRSAKPSIEERPKGDGGGLVLVQNTSRFPTDEVVDLVEFATADVDMAGVCVNVKNTRSYACAGYAYDGVPEISNAPAGSRYLVTIRLGPDREFPSTMAHRKRSPTVEVACWREALVTVAAHEAKHIEQYRLGAPRSEVVCERFAAWVLEIYRWNYEPASTRVAAPSRESRMERMSSAVPTKIGVSRSV